MRTLTVRNDEVSAAAPGLGAVTGSSTTASTGGSSAEDSASCSVMVMHLSRVRERTRRDGRGGNGGDGGGHEFAN